MITNSAKLNKEAAIAFFADADAMISRGEKEDAIRYLLCTNLPKMFPEDPWWISLHAKLAEANSTFTVNDRIRKGFVDVLIGKTAIEYEKDLTKKAVFDEGYRQVEEYCAGLLNEGANPEDIIGVLSDTVRWYSYDVKLTGSPEHAGHYGPADVALVPRDHVNMTDVTEENLTRFERFINCTLGRLGSRKLRAESLAADFGLSSSGGAAYVYELQTFVANAIVENPSYANLIENLWDGFINGMRDAERGDFLKDYTHELYLVTLAKLVCANALNQGDVDIRQSFVGSVLNGTFFQNLGIENFIEYDYFGWLNNGNYLTSLVQIATKIQYALSAYDFRDVHPEDLFGPLLAQMATVDKRLLLGQAPTPQHLASRIVDHFLDKYLTAEPRILDMCCGSGVFIVEVLKRFLPDRHNPDYEQALAVAYSAVSGIDIDPLAVILSKANWLMLMRDHIGSFNAGLHIPVYHADSMFTATPVSRNNESTGTAYLKLKLDDQMVELPAFLFEPEFRTVLNNLIDKCDAVAMAVAEGDGEFSLNDAIHLVDQFARPVCPDLDDEDLHAMVLSIETLGKALVFLQRNNRNGIWPFILGNGFMPSLMKGQYNGIISNPPWLALSRLGDNPYKDTLGKKADAFGIKPEGSSFLHTELATVFFVGSINRYLETDGQAACIMPQSILNGRNEEAFRKDGYLEARERTDINIEEIWKLPKPVFKNRAIVLFAKKEKPADSYRNRVVAGSVLDESLAQKATNFYLLSNGATSAYSESSSKLEDAYEKLPFEQGFDAFPRTVLFYQSEQQPNGAWTLQSIPNQGSELSFVTSDAKKAPDFSIQPASNVDGRYIFTTLISKQVLPFFASDPLHLFLPIEHVEGEVRKIPSAKLAVLSSSTSNLIKQILECRDNGKFVFSSYQDFIDKVDWRRKLSKSLGDNSRFQVVYGASGENLAAAIVDMSAIDKDTPFCADQTLYWLGCPSENSAYFYMGMLNSSALNKAIKDFQPEGNFGKRHIHKLPLMFVPEYDPDNELHNAIVEASIEVFNDVAHLVATDSNAAKLANPSIGALASRRTKFRRLITELDSFSRLNTACEDVL